MKFTVNEYIPKNKRSNKHHKIFVYLITSPKQVFNTDDNPVLKALKKHDLSNSVGIYFYRFKKLNNFNSFSKIGEVSRKEGIEKRFSRGWHGTDTYSDTYLTKGIHNDIKLISKTNPMYFVFYQFDLLNSFPKIDEQIAFKKHLDHFNYSTKNNERPNSNYDLGKNLAWHNTAFDEVLNMKFPDSSSYPF